LHILQAAGVVNPQSEVDPDTITELFQQFDGRLVDLTATTWLTANAENFDYMQAAGEPERSLAIPSASDVASLGRRSTAMPVYQLIKDGKVASIVLPIYGKGMWSEIHAYVAVDPTKLTITGLVIHSHGETPGIGDRIESTQWLNAWQGKQANKPIRLGVAGTGQEQGNNIDAITGATITTQSLVAIVNFWLGEWGYGPLLIKLSEQDY
jgi:Na+-transporting NADH:ubiquinone oxidoreductase subunit C